MKQLLVILLLLTFAPAKGQIVLNPPHDRMVWKEIIDSTWTYKLYVKDLIDYQKECYNDTLHISGWGKSYSYSAKYILYPANNHFGHELVNQKNDTIIHRTPTFEGFIEYMKKKYQVK